MSDTQYQKDYDKAMADLEAGKPITLAEEPAVEKPDEEEAQAETNSVDEPKVQQKSEDTNLEERLIKAEKALKDTQRWGHNVSEELANLKREREQAARAAEKPSILNQHPELEQAIEYVNATPKKQDLDLATILDRALPDLNTLLDDQEFKNKFFKVRDDSNGTWDDPLAAIRDVNSLIVTFEKDRAIADAQKDFAKREKKLTAMSVPSGSGGSSTPQKEINEADRIRDMPKSEFEAMRHKALGY